LAFSDADIILEGDYRTSMVQHCHIENHTAYAYMEDTTHITIVTSTAIPHILRQQLWMKSSGVKHFFIFVL
jgi:xanthine dehydrogenase molybdenum-binding subunit